MKTMHPVRKCFFRMTFSCPFQAFIIIIILINSTLLALDRYPITDAELAILENIHFALFFLFLIELIVKLAGLGFRGYVRDLFNIMDALVVIFSAVEFILLFSNVTQKESRKSALSVFRGLRLLSIFKFVRSWHSFQILMIKIGKALKDVSYFSLVMFIFLMAYALIGQEFFAYSVYVNDAGNYVDHGTEDRKSVV